MEQEASVSGQQPCQWQGKRRNAASDPFDLPEEKKSGGGSPPPVIDSHQKPNSRFPMAQDITGVMG